MFQTVEFDALNGVEFVSPDALALHFKLYQGYVANLNKLDASLEKADKTTVEFSETKRRYAWEFNGCRLHELFFENLTKEFRQIDQDSDLLQVLVGDFGSFDDWQKDFEATAMMRGIGWVIMYYDAANDKIINAWINEHEVAHLAGLKPLLVLDVFEHAYLLDYKTNRADYLQAFWLAVNWPIVEKRFKK